MDCYRGWWHGSWVPMLLVIAGVALALSPLAHEADAAPSRKPEPVRFIMKRFKHSVAGCGVGGKEACGLMALSYPIVTAGPAALRSAVNAHVLKVVFYDGPYPNSDRQVRRDVIEGAASLAGSRRDCERGEKTYPIKGRREVRVSPDCGGWPWSERRHVKVLLNRPFSFTISEEDVWYSGTPHPTSHVAHRNYDPKTGRLIELDHIFTTSGLVELKKTAERVFRREVFLSERESLADAGYFRSHGGRLFLSADFFFSDGELGVWYDRYVAGGPAVEIRIPYSAIRHLVRPEWRAIIR